MKHTLILDDEDMPFWRLVMVHRVARGWTQSELANYATEVLRSYYDDEYVRVNLQQVSHFERSIRIKVDAAAAILQVLGIEEES